MNGTATATPRTWGSRAQLAYQPRRIRRCGERLHHQVRGIRTGQELRIRRIGAAGGHHRAHRDPAHQADQHGQREIAPPPAAEGDTEAVPGHSQRLSGHVPRPSRPAAPAGQRCLHQTLTYPPAPGKEASSCTCLVLATPYVRKSGGTGGIRPGYPMPKVLLRILAPAAQDGAKTAGSPGRANRPSGLASGRMADADCMIIHAGPVPERPVAA